ncbi:MAG: hypothetical protein AB7V50_11065 [Vampirovibrionia bacterium]
MLYIKVQKPVFVCVNACGKELYLDPKTNTVTDRETAFANYEGIKSSSINRLYIEALEKNNSTNNQKVATVKAETMDAMTLFNRLSQEVNDYKSIDNNKRYNTNSKLEKVLKQPFRDESNIVGFFSLQMKKLMYFLNIQFDDDIEDEENEVDVDVNSGNMSDNKDKKRKKRWFMFA